MPERDPVSVTETPEFQSALKDERAAMRAEMAAMRADLLDDLKASLVGVRPEEKQDVQTLFSQMALAIAEISDQGTHRKRVAPEVLAAREAHRDRMGELILASRKLPENEKPRYRLIGKVYLKEQLIEPFQRNADKRTVPTEIRWTNAPNAAMRPANAAAKKIYAEFLGWVGGASEQGTSLVKAPAWVTNSGAILTNSPNATAALKTVLPQFIDMDDPPGVGGNGSVEDDDDAFAIVSQTDPRAPEIHVLGTVAPPARRLVSSERRA